MELNEKLQELRKQKGMTQEELAERLYVSRTAISKWESGRGYPNIESLRAIAKFFSVTVDELLSTDEVLRLAEADNKEKETHFRDLIYGLLDICGSMLLFLPLFAQVSEGGVQSVSLLMLKRAPLYLKLPYFVTVIGMVLVGVLILTLQNNRCEIWLKCKTKLSLIFGVLAVLLFMISAQPYASVFAFSLLAIKALVLIRRQ